MNHQVSNQAFSTKELVLELISEEKNLTAKQVYHKLVRNHAATISYQAVHKLLKQLLEDRTLSKNEKSEYTLSEEYVKKMKAKTQKILENYSKEKNIRLEDMEEGESRNYTFNGILELGWFLIDRVGKAPNPNKTPLLALWRFCYSIVGLDEKHLTGLKESMKLNNWIIFVEENNEMDKMFAQTLKTLGAKQVKLGIKNCATKLTDKTIIGNYIVDITYPKAFRKIWELQNKLPKNLSQFNLGKHLHLMRLPYPKMNTTITKNKELAEEYRKEYLKA